MQKCISIMEAARPPAPMGETGESWESCTVPASQRAQAPSTMAAGPINVDENGLYAPGRDVGMPRFPQDGRHTSGDGGLDASCAASPNPVSKTAAHLCRAFA